MPTLAAPLILASASSIRAELLRSVGLEARIIPAEGLDEDALKATLTHLPPQEKALALADAKAAFVSAQHPDALVIGADQICALGDVILSKPRTAERAAEQLRQLRGATHAQYSAVSVFRAGACVWHYVATARLTMRELCEEEITAYIALDAPLQSCGAYMFEKHGKHLFSEVHGTDDVIQGMPLTPLLAALYARHLLRL